MRRTELVLAVLLALFVFGADFAGAGARTIIGYAPGEFAVRDSIETQAKALVKEIKNDLGRKSNTDLQIFVEGFADRTGFSAENDRIAKERADGIKAILSREFPEARINLVSRGDSIDRRQVMVEWKYVSVLPAPTEKTAMKAQNNKIYIIIGILALAAVLIFVFSESALRGRKLKKATKAFDEIRWLDLVVDGEKYSVRVEVKDGRFLSPFRTRNNFQIIRESVKKTTDSVKGCLSKNEFKQQKIELMSKGIIKIEK